MIMICWPCIKELMNNGFRAAAKTLHSMAVRSEKMVKRGQITAAQRDEWLKEVTEFEEPAIKRMNDLSLKLAMMATGEDEAAKE